MEFVNLVANLTTLLAKQIKLNAVVVIVNLLLVLLPMQEYAVYSLLLQIVVTKGMCVIVMLHAVLIYLLEVLHYIVLFLVLLDVVKYLVALSLRIVVQTHQVQSVMHL